MLSRLVLTASRFSLASTSRFIQTTAKKTARFGGNTSGGFKFAENSGFGVRTGPTLKEKLLGPTTGKPFIYGTYALAGASAFGIGMLMYYGLVSKEQSILQNSTLWPTYVRERVSTTYTYLLGSLAVTAASGVAASRSPAIMRITAGNGILAFIGTMAALVGTAALCRSIDYDNGLVKHAAWLLHCGTLGAVLAPLCFLGGPVLMRAAWYTAGIAAGLSATAITAPSEKFLMMSGPLSMGLGVVLVANIGAFFLPPGSAIGASLASIVVYGGLILFSAFLLYDTQRMVKKAEMYPLRSREYNIPSYDPINAQMSIYMDIIQIFMRMAMIMSGSNNRRK